MFKADVKLILNREPSVPLRLHLANGKVFNIGFRDVVRILEDRVLIFICLKEGSRQAKGYDRFPF